MGRGSTGPRLDQVFAIAPQILPAKDLSLRADPLAPQVHAFIEPASRVAIERYEERLAETRIAWTKVWP